MGPPHNPVALFNSIVIQHAHLITTTPMRTVITCGILDTINTITTLHIISIMLITCKIGAYAHRAGCAGYEGCATQNAYRGMTGCAGHADAPGCGARRGCDEYACFEVYTGGGYVCAQGGSYQLYQLQRPRRFMWCVPLVWSVLIVMIVLNITTG